MRIRALFAIAALVLVPATVRAQDQGASAYNKLSAEFGVRGTSMTGDGARYERYRDLGDGLFLDNLRFKRQSNDWFFDLGANHVGRKDQRYSAVANQPGKFKAFFVYDEIPMLLSRTTQTLFNDGAIDSSYGLLTIPDAIQTAAQTNSATLTSAFAANARTFELKTTRRIAEGGFIFMPTADLTLKATLRNTDREGYIPYGGSFGHGNVVETAAPTYHAFQDFDTSGEWMRGRVLVRGGFVGSWFNNEIANLTFDNPWRSVDTSSASSRGRMALAPNSTFFGVNGMISVKLPQNSRATAYVSTGQLRDGDEVIMPYTINTAATGALAFPRVMVDGAADTMAANLSFTSRPTANVNFSLRFQSYEYDNKTPEFIVYQRSSYDNGISSSSTPIMTEPFGMIRHNFDADLRYSPRAGTGVGVGYQRLAEERSHRIFEETVDNVFRLTFDTVTSKWVTIRSKYEHAQRRGHAFEEEALTEVSEQPGLRHFDVASRDRNRLTLTGMLNPMDKVAVNFSVGAGNDDYLESVMGLRDNKHRVYGAGFDTMPADNVMFGVSYLHEKYMALSRSRQANPTTPAGCVNVFPAPAGQTTCQFYDESRNWAADTDDRSNSVIIRADFTKLANEKLDVNLMWDLNRSKGTYAYITGPVSGRTLPEETPNLTPTLPTPTQLPDVVSNLYRGTLDLTYSVSARVGLGLSWWYEKYEVQDWALDAESTKNLVNVSNTTTGATNAVLLGYLYRPYTANTVFGKLIVRW